MFLYIITYNYISSNNLVNNWKKSQKNCYNTAAEYLREDKNALSRNSKENMKIIFNII